MMQRKRGHIINVASSAGVMAMPMASGYACAKAGVMRLTDSLAASVRDLGIFVFAISPGPTKTAMTGHILNSSEGQKWMPEFQRIPSSQWTDPEKIGRLVVALAGGTADGLTGRILHVNQDLNDLIRRTEEINKQDLFTLRLRQ
jgi:3-oxoacyl-[acyl-carrier protein] reductase